MPCHLIPCAWTTTPPSSPAHPLLHRPRCRDAPGAVLNQIVVTVWFSTGLLTPMIQNAVFTTWHIQVSALRPNQTTLEEGVGWGRTGSIRERRRHSPYWIISKAFDRVNHNILFKKISERGVPQCLLRWFFSYLSRRQQRTRVKRKTSSWRYLYGSMPQGSLLGPVSFLVLIDDLAPGCQTHKYVDDTTMSEILKSANSPSHMLIF